MIYWHFLDDFRHNVLFERIKLCTFFKDFMCKEIWNLLNFSGRDRKTQIFQNLNIQQL